MALLSNSFTCPNGHTFDANAKIRARCPECGAMAKRPFGNQTVARKSATTDTGNAGNPQTEPTTPATPTAKGPVILRQGRHTMAARKVTKPAPTKPKTPVKRTVTKPTRAVVSTPKPKVVSGGVVKMRRASGTPTITRLPKKSSVSKVASTISGRNKSFMQRVIDRYGI